MPCYDSSADAENEVYVSQLTKLLCRMIRKAHKHNVTYLLDEETRQWWDAHRVNPGHREHDE